MRSAPGGYVTCRGIARWRRNRPALQGCCPAGRGGASPPHRRSPRWPWACQRNTPDRSCSRGLTRCRAAHPPSMPSATVSSPSASASDMMARANATASTPSALPSLARQAFDEGAIDLQDVDREAVQVGQRGIAGAEVVERQAHAEHLQGAEGLLELRRVIQQQALGDLEDQAVRVEMRCVASAARTSATTSAVVEIASSIR